MLCGFWALLCFAIADVLLKGWARLYIYISHQQSIHSLVSLSLGYNAGRFVGY